MKSVSLDSPDVGADPPGSVDHQRRANGGYYAAGRGMRQPPLLQGGGGRYQPPAAGVRSAAHCKISLGTFDSLSLPHLFDALFYITILIIVGIEAPQDFLNVS